jgi:hypothetical protein
MLHVDPIGHTRPHPPQFVASVRTSTQRPLHTICGIGHTVLHVPLPHAPVMQVRPHRPQFAGSVDVSTQRPLHSVWKSAHIGGLTSTRSAVSMSTASVIVTGASRRPESP